MLQLCWLCVKLCEGKPEVSKCSYQEWAQITSPGLQSARNPSTTSLTDSKGQIRLRRRNGASPFIVERRPGTTGQPSAVTNSPSFGVSCRWALWSPQSWNFLFPYSSLGSPTRCPWGVLRKYWRELLPLPQCKTSWWAFKAKLHVTWEHGSKICLWVISWHHCKKRMQRAGMHWAFQRCLFFLKLSPSKELSQVEHRDKIVAKVWNWRSLAPFRKRSLGSFGGWQIMSLWILLGSALWWCWKLFSP